MTDYPTISVFVRLHYKHIYNQGSVFMVFYDLLLLIMKFLTVYHIFITGFITFLVKVVRGVGCGGVFRDTEF